MLTLIMGGSGSGKSSFAEEYIVKHFKDDRRYYIATMQVFDQEGQAKIERHQRMRSNKGFLTIEQTVSIEEAMDNMEHKLASKTTALLECMSNLVANEMFSDEIPKKCEPVTEKIIQGVENLSERIKHLVIVTNNVFEDGIIYDETTMEYIKTMGNINEKLATMADKVIEIVVGIPLVVKEGK